MTGPFTTVLMLILVVVGVALLFSVPFFILLSMITHKGKKYELFEWVIIIAACLVSGAFILDGVWWVIAQLVTWMG